jgi:hypothetical protein
MRILLLGMLMLGGPAVAGHGADAPPLATVEEATAFAGRTATVLVFLYTDCPIANQAAPELARLETAFRPQGVRFYRVYAGDSASEADIARHGEAFGLDFPAVQDTALALVKRTGATVTPEAVVYDASGTRRYRGRINDRYEDLGRHRPQATRHDLRDALEALVAGRDVPNPETRAVGCYLPRVDDDGAAPEANDSEGRQDGADE